MRSLGWTTTVSAVNVIWCFITKMKKVCRVLWSRLSSFWSFCLDKLCPQADIWTSGKALNICLCVCFSTDVYLWWEASVRLGELSSGWCFWFWYRNGVGRVHECSQVPQTTGQVALQTQWRLSTASPSWSFRGCSFPRVGVGVIHFHYMANVCISISSGVHGRDCCSFQDGVVCLGWLPVFFAFHHTKLIIVSLSPMFLYSVTTLASFLWHGHFSLAFLQDFMLLGNEGSCAALHPGWCTVELLQRSRYSVVFSACSVTIFSLARGSQ